MADAGEILVVGDGGWGTAIANVLSDNGSPVVMWSHDQDYAAEMAQGRENRKFLPGIKLHDSLVVTADPARAFERANMVIAVAPSKFLRVVLKRLKSNYNGAPVLSAAKGIEVETLSTCTGIINQEWSPSTVAAISGPSHAEEVGRRLPATVVVAGADIEFIREVQSRFSNRYFRVYTSPDIVGVEFGGAVKNVIAIAAGICDGLKLGDNAKSALITRGIMEIRRLGVSMGARPDTFFGLSGMGDLITTCISPYGRNRRVGEMLAMGKTLAEVEASTEMVAEGVQTTKAVVGLARKRGITMPISEEVFRILFEGKSPVNGVRDLMTRALKSEAETFE
ncbi:MAG: NAD(P)H-dependent glycerol-3-phosphate dehydrogenase [Candidatus Brocadiia bacterium]